MKYSFIAILLIPLLYACDPETQDLDENTETAKEVQEEVITVGDSIINLAFTAHGGDLYNSAAYQFVFRGVQYTFENEGTQYTYSKIDTSNGQLTVDRMTNDSFERTINEALQELEEKERFKYQEALNSVIYFATLPHKLIDKAVNKTYVSDIAIKDNNYFVVEVSFDEEGGGVRFRAANNPRVVEGITFQDYVNYGAPVGTPLAELPVLFESDSLKELSLINTEDVFILSTVK
ncbi:DUF6503 family protein [Crocinitomix catalasitica]|uniref:DUF6503 family protein n=1 Tax=Crocinitomix catalasitica TaxID=184607 RepID=UPI00047F5A87|nr:DUF6503 family protein [Crocinitomix catalasitica]